MKTLSLLLLMCLIPKYAPGQALGMVSISTLQQESEVVNGLTRDDVKRLMKTARTADEFEHLAIYFDRQAEECLAKYEAEQKELDRLLALRYHARSYPTQVESTRNRMDHYKTLSHKYTEQAGLYRARAKEDAAIDALSAPVPR